MADPREIATEILRQIIALKDTSNLQALEQSTNTEHGFIKMLTFTSLRRHVFLRKVMQQFIKKKLPAKAAFADFAIEAGACELLFMDTPDYAVINSYVNLIKKHCDKFIAGLANAVLRRIASEKDILLKHDRNEVFPDSFLEILNNSYSKETIKQLQIEALREPPLTLSVKGNPQEWAQKLDGILLAQNSITLTKNPGKLQPLPGFADGQWWVQDYAASLAVSTLPDLQGKRVLDLCAAPGGKTAQLLNKGAIVTSLDSSQQRLNTLKQNMERLHFSPEKIICGDALNYLQNFSGTPFDIILLDAPCSATGIFRRHPEVMHLKTKFDVLRQAELQKQILENASKALSPNGTLVYCTCSIAKEEGEMQITSFLATHKEFQISPLSSVEFPSIITPEGFIRTLPSHLHQQGGCDSFFIARLTKVK